LAARGACAAGRADARIGVLMPGDESDPAMKLGVSAFTQALAGLGWTEGRNVRMDVRWHGDDNNRIPALAQELTITKSRRRDPRALDFGGYMIEPYRGGCEPERIQSHPRRRREVS
jgi:hypothetical protein